MGFEAIPLPQLFTPYTVIVAVPVYVLFQSTVAVVPVPVIVPAVGVKFHCVCGQTNLHHLSLKVKV